MPVPPEQIDRPRDLFVHHDQSRIQGDQQIDLPHQTSRSRLQRDVLDRVRHFGHLPSGVFERQLHCGKLARIVFLSCTGHRQQSGNQAQNSSFFYRRIFFACLLAAKVRANKCSERRGHRQIENKVFGFDSAEPHPILWKCSERQAQRQIENRVFGFDSAEGASWYYENVVKGGRSGRGERTKFSPVRSRVCLSVEKKRQSPTGQNAGKVSFLPMRRC